VCSPQAGEKLWRTSCPGGLARAGSGLDGQPREWVSVEEATRGASPVSWTKAALRWKAPRVRPISFLFAGKRVRRPSAPGWRVVRATRYPSRTERCYVIHASGWHGAHRSAEPPACNGRRSAGGLREQVVRRGPRAQRSLARAGLVRRDGRSAARLRLDQGPAVSASNRCRDHLVTGGVRERSGRGKPS